MCVITTGRNNNANFRIEANLNSIFDQNYTNYTVVIVDDASDDGSQQIFRNYLEAHGI